MITCHVPLTGVNEGIRQMHAGEALRTVIDIDIDIDIGIGIA